MFETKVVEEIKTHILCLMIFCFKKSCHFWDNMEKYCGGTDHRWQYRACAFHAR